MDMIKILLLAVVLVTSSPALALEEEPPYSTQTLTDEEIVGQIQNFTSTPEGGVDWKLFSETEDVPYKVEREGQEWEGVKPKFSAGLKNLDGKTIKMSGYMFPLDQTAKQSQFLFGPFPLSCPYHYHAPNSLIIEVHTDKPISFSYEPITLQGTLELVPEDYEYNTFYKLQSARIVK